MTLSACFKRHGLSVGRLTGINEIAVSEGDNGLASTTSTMNPQRTAKRACYSLHRRLVESWQILVNVLNATKLHALSCCRIGMNVSTDRV